MSLNNEGLLLSQRKSMCPRWNRAYVVRRKTPSLQRSRAFLAAVLEANSTIPLPVERPRSSTTTIDLSISPNCEKASSRSSLETYGDRFFTDRAAECVANRTRKGLPRIGVSSISVFAISARARDSWKTKSMSLWERFASLSDQTTGLKKKTFEAGRVVPAGWIQSLFLCWWRPQTALHILQTSSWEFPLWCHLAGYQQTNGTFGCRASLRASAAWTEELWNPAMTITGTQLLAVYTKQVRKLNYNGYIYKLCKLTQPF